MPAATKVDAKLAAIRADSHDGLRRTNADKRRAVRTPEIADKMSDQQIADRVVARIR
jgi:hypothetical protein